ncbi:MAG: hypothetical protein ABR964_00420 [Tepidisphaeraceae bacterium]|jgi:hypothetical protein
MTIPQVLHALGMDSVSPAEAARIAADRRAIILDQVAAANGWLPSRLLDVPPSDIATQIRLHGGGAVDADALGGQIQQYLRDKGVI